jgi:hypothetical protein
MDESRLNPTMKKVLPLIREVIVKNAPVNFRVEFTAGQEWYHHGHKSLHHSGSAVDIRTKTLPDKGIGALSEKIGARLQEDLNLFMPNTFRVLVNDQGIAAPHIHIQYNPGPKMTTPGDDEKSQRWKKGVA